MTKTRNFLNMLAVAVTALLAVACSSSDEGDGLPLVTTEYGTTYYTDGLLRYTLTTGQTAAVSGVEAGCVHADIPATVRINGAERPVTVVSHDAFRGCETLASVTLPGSLEQIGDWAFSKCTRLERVVLPASVKIYGEFIFSGCESLTDVSLPEGMTEIPEGLLAQCTALTTVRIPQTVSVIGFGAFSGCSRLSGVTLPAGLTRLGANAFSQCTRLSSLTLPEGITTIGKQCFMATGLTALTLPNSLRETGEYLFEYCTSLQRVTFGTGIKKIGYAPFHYCDQIGSVTILATTPPAASGLDELGQRNALTLYVPAAALESYVAAYQSQLHPDSQVLPIGE